MNRWNLNDKLCQLLRVSAIFSFFINLHSKLFYPDELGPSRVLVLRFHPIKISRKLKRVDQLPCAEWMPCFISYIFDHHTARGNMFLEVLYTGIPLSEPHFLQRVVWLTEKKVIRTFSRKGEWECKLQTSSRDISFCFLSVFFVIKCLEF